MATVNKTAELKPAEIVARRDPKRSRERILQAAMGEFASKGLQGARMDEIAQRAGANKRMLYHYFGNKEALFLAVLERAYKEIRDAERDLQLQHLAPDRAMERLVRFTFGYFLQAPHFVPLLNSENLHRARHLRRSEHIREMHSNMIDMIRDVLRRGVAAGVFRDGVDPMQLFISMTGAGYFYFSNIHTLSTIFGRDLTEPAEVTERESHVTELILGYLRP